MRIPSAPLIRRPIEYSKGPESTGEEDERERGKHRESR